MKRVISAVIVLIGLAAPAWADMKACEDAWVRKNYETLVIETFGESRGLWRQLGPPMR